MTFHNLQLIGFKREAQEGTNPITASNNWYRFGIQTSSIGKFPMSSNTLTQLYRGTSLTPAQIRMLTRTTAGQVIFTPTNAFLWYVMLGGYSFVSSVHSISPSDNAESLTVKWESSNGTTAESLYYDMTGARITNMTFAVETNNTYAGSTVMFSGLKVSEATVKQHDYLTTIDGGTVANQPLYQMDSNAVLTIDSVDYTPDFVGATVSVTQTFKTLQIDGEENPTRQYPKERVYALTLSLTRSDHLDLIDTMLAYKNTDQSFSSGSFKVYQDAIHYIQFDFTDLAVASIEIDNVLTSDSKIPTYACTFLAKSMSVEANDGAPAYTTL